MHTKKCCVIPTAMRENDRMQKAMLEIGDTSLLCSFENHLPVDYEYNGEYFCILHLPFEAKEKDKKLFAEANIKIHELLKLRNKLTNYNFIAGQNLDFHNTGPYFNQLSFIGSDLWSLTIRNTAITLEILSFTATRLRGINKIEGNFNRITIINSECSSQLLIINSTVDECLVKGSKFLDNEGKLCIDSGNHGIHLNGSTFNKFRFIDNDCDTSLMFDGASIQELSLRDSRFSLCPSFFNTEFTEKNKNITLSNRVLFDYKRLINQTSPGYKKQVKCWFVDENCHSGLEHYYDYMNDQYRKYREIYNITKTRGMFSEQGEYFYLMQYFFERTKESGIFNSTFSRLYRVFSDYGQSTYKPIIYLIITWVFFGALYGGNWLLSIKQIVKPYSIVFEKAGGSCIFFGILESTIAIALLALFLIALRWHFRKA